MRIQQAKDNFKHGDFALAERQLIDCILDSNEIGLFKKMLQGLDAKDLAGEWTEKAFIELCSALEQFAPQMPQITPKTTLMKVDQIGKRYHKSGFTIAPLSFEVHYGQVIGLVGENGNGNGNNGDDGNGRTVAQGRVVKIRNKRLNQQTHHHDRQGA